MSKFLRHVISAPFIWAMVVPVVIFDITASIYQHICFPLWGIKTIPRKSYIRMDREKLPFLGIWDKFNCAYCAYANGVMQWGAAVAGATEAYWCSMKHKPAPGYQDPPHHKNFMRYGDQKAYEKKKFPVNRR